MRGRVLELGLFFGGMLIALPAVRWWAKDVARIPGPVWFWTGHQRRRWRRSVAAGWLLGGWIALILVWTWAHSAERRELLEEADDFAKSWPAHPHQRSGHHPLTP